METPDLEERDGYTRSHDIAQERKVKRDSVFNVPLPSVSGSRGYPLSKKICLLEMWERDKLSVPKSLWSSLYWWSKRLVPYKMTGNKQSYVVTGHHRFLLALFKRKYSCQAWSVCCLYRPTLTRWQNIYQQSNYQSSEANGYDQEEGVHHCCLRPKEPKTTLKILESSFSGEHCQCSTEKVDLLR